MVKRVILLVSLTAPTNLATTRDAWSQQSLSSARGSYTLGSSFVERFANSANGVVWSIDPKPILKCDPDVPSEEPLIRCHRAISGSPIRNKLWFTGLATILTDLGSFQKSEAPLDFAPEIALSFGTGDSSTELLIDLGHNRVEITSAGLPTITGTLADPTLRLASLIKEARPGDSNLQAQLSRAQADLRRSIEMAETVGPFWPDCSQGAGVGEFVYYDQEPIPIERPQPSYPRGVATDAKVVVHAFVDDDGRVCFVRILHGLEPFAEYAIEAVKRWTFEPASTKGTPVGVWVEIPFEFRFSGARLDPSDRYEEPKPVSRVYPRYPEFAKEARIEGRVVLRVWVDTNGEVINVKITEGVTGLNEAAVEAIKHWKFRPARMNGKPVASSLEIPLEFHL
jgi:TonB family protein